MNNIKNLSHGTIIIRCSRCKMIVVDDAESATGHCDECGKDICRECGGVHFCKCDTKLCKRCSAPDGLCMPCWNETWEVQK